MSNIDLSTALSTALSGLNVNQQQLAVLSNNISNANTAGYSRQVVNQQEQIIAGQGVGVNVEDIVRQINQNLVGAVVQQNSAVGQATAINGYTTQIQNLIGQPGNNNSLSTGVNNFFNDLQSLAQTPQNNALQQTAVDAGVALASQIQQTSQGLYTLQFQSDGGITDAIKTINSDIQSIATLNQNIRTATLQGQAVGGLEDQRDNALNDLAGYVNVTTFTNADGTLNVNTSNGISLVSSSTAFEVSYNSAGSINTFEGGASLSPIVVQQLDNLGNVVGTPTQLVSGGVPSQVTTVLTSGKLFGLLTMRDQQIPDLMAQLDTFASTVRDQVNTIQNSGSGFPGSSTLTGERAVNAGDISKWSGSVQIAALTSGGQSVNSPYSDEPYGLPPLNLDLGSLNTGNGAGNPSVQGIINAINQYYGPQSNKVELGNLNNIQMVSDSPTIPASPPGVNFDLNLDNISAKPASVFVTGVTVVPSSGLNTTSVTSPVDINVANYTTTAGSGTVTINTSSSTAGLTVGEQVYLSGPGTIVDGIAAGNLTGFFTVTGVGTNSFTITAAGGATGAAGGVTAPVGTSTVTPPYDTMPPGENGRTAQNGLFNINFGANFNPSYYTVTLNVAVSDGSGNAPAVSQISYQVTNNNPNAMNTYYAPQTATGQGNIVAPSSHQAIAQAILVDANGNELPKNANGTYVTNENGFLVIKAASNTNTIAINSLDSIEQGQPNNTPPIPGTNQGFSSYFALNNFFKSNKLTGSGDTVAGSALNMQVVQSLQDNPGLLSLGQLTQNKQSVIPNAPPNYTYVLNPGDNSVIQQMASIATNIINFPESGGLGATSQTLSGYMGAVIGATSSIATAATANQTNAQTLLTGFQKQASTASGVNLDTELANTVIYQNAYSASARIITVVSTLFNTLLSSFTG
jgi:flagellar hook-associated protein 1 FlgK